MVEQIRKLAAQGFNKREVAKILGVSIHIVQYRAQKYGIEFKNKKPRYPTGKEKQVLRHRFFELYQEGKTIPDIIRQLGISRTTAQLWEMDIEQIRKEFYKEDPRSKVCQQIQSCGHSRCHLAPRCPAYRAYVARRAALGLER